MKGIKESIPPIFADYPIRTATEECQKVNPIFYLKSSPCPHSGCSTCHSVQRWQGEDWRMFWMFCVETVNPKSQVQPKGVTLSNCGLDQKKE